MTDPGPLCCRTLAAILIASALSGCGPRSLASDLVDLDRREPQYGGTLDVGSRYVTLSALSWDPSDWAWKLNHDTGMYYEQLFAGDLDKSVSRGGHNRFITEAWLPSDVIRGELAESWEWEGPLTVVIHLRRGVRFPAKPGVMASRELDAHDVVFSFERQDRSPKKIPTYFDHIERVWARDDHTVVFDFKEYNAEWDYRFGYGYYSQIIPRELADVDGRDWRNAVGTGPLQLARYIQGNSQTYERNPDYWDRETIDGVSYPIPFIDRLTYRIIKDEATYLTAIRTGKLDILEPIRWLAVDHLKKTTPELLWSRYLANSGSFVALRVDREPFDDLRVRRALNLAVDQRQIAELHYGGHAELFAYPMHPDFGDYYQPFHEMPPSVQELYGHDPEKARRLLGEAGYPDGFRFKMQVCACDPTHMDLIPLLVSYLAEVGVEVEVQPMEYASFLSVMTTRNHAPGYLMASGHVNPTTSLRKSFVSGQTWNPSGWSNPDFDRRMRTLFLTRDEGLRQEMVRELTVEILDQAPYIWLPVQYLYTAWWPWVKNYNGELRAGAVRPGPIYARIWIDQQLKRELGFR